jgi:hypothetical protein
MIPPTPFLHAFIVRRPNPSGPVFSYSCVFALSTPLSCVEFPPSYSSSTSSPLPLTHFQSLLSAPSSPPPSEGALERTCRPALASFFVFLPSFLTWRGFDLGYGFRARVKEREREYAVCQYIIITPHIETGRGNRRISSTFVGRESVAPSMRSCKAPAPSPPL